MAKKKKNAVPKRIAGVKLPKAMRKGLNELLASQKGRKLVGDALLAAGAAIVAKQTKAGAKAKRFMDEQAPKEALRDPGGALASGGSALAFALGEAGRTFADALTRGKAMADAKAAWPEIDETGSKKKPPANPEATPTH
ncbi:MAG TPA: hypothetical protein VIO94_02950 [Phenylobacterium sp.]